MYTSIMNKHNNQIKEMNRKSHNYSSTAKRRGIKKCKFDVAHFIAWDGEGLDLSETLQVYGLFANSELDYIIDTEGLSTKSCLEFLTSNRYPKNCIHVCFGASYDVNMILWDLPEDLLRKLHKGDEYVQWDIYELEYRPRKSFTIRKFKTEERDGVVYKIFNRKKKKFIFERTVTLWDVFGFFQARFIDVLKDWTKNTEYEQKYSQAIIDIENGKDRRGSFSVKEVESFVLPYCLKECEALKDIMGILHTYLKQAGLKLARWDGAGAVAAATLKLYNVKPHIRIGEKFEQEPYSQDIIEAAECAYFGGWIEAYLFGDIRQRVYHYDLCSAYPSVTRELLSLSMGHWKTKKYGNWLPLEKVISKLEKLPSYWLAHIRWENGPLYGPNPFSWRNRLGTVSRPMFGQGWQWYGEILSAYKLFPNMKVYIDQIHYFIPDENCVKPFAFIDDMYKYRRLLKEQGNGLQMVYKLAMNSIYGKLAQSLGYNEERDIKPPYHCILYAGIITSETRRKILEAVMQKPHAIISIATDGIYSLEPLDLDIGTNLGQWEFTLHDDMTLVQPGFYWYSTNGKEKNYYRGFNKDCIKRGEVISAYLTGVKSLPVGTTRFVTLGAAVGLNNFETWHTWRKKDRNLDLYMSKSSKRSWKGDMFPGNPLLHVTMNKSYDLNLFLNNWNMLESKKYTYAWDENREQGSWDGQSIRTIAEEMFHMELSPMA